MSRLSSTRLTALALLSACAVAHGADNSQVNRAPVNPTDARLFREALVEKGLADRWEGDPLTLSSQELYNAYPGVRFFYTFQPRPLPPGAPMPELLDRHKRAMQEYQKQSLRMTLGINDKGFANAYRTPADFNVGLRPVQSADQAKVAAAAILSLMDADHIGPGAIPAEEVTVTKTDNGWSCRVEQPRGIKGLVTFDEAGRCTGASKTANYSRPLPP